MVNKTLLVSIIIPNYNGASLLSRTIPKLLKVIDKKVVKEIIIVDDCSQDDSVEVINKFISENKLILIKLIQNNSNLGFSSTINTGVEKASGGLVYLMNSDTIITTDIFTPLLKHFQKDEKLFAVGVLDKSIEGSKTILRGRGLARWERGFLLHSRGEADKTDTFWVSGGSGIFRKSIWKKLHGMNTVYSPFYWEDIDLSYRARKSGYAVLFDPNISITHEHGKGAIKSYYSERDITIISYKNQILFVWSCITDAKLLFNHVLWLPVHLMRTIFSGDLQFSKGFFRAISQIDQVLSQRRVRSKTFIKNDSDLI